MGLRTLADLAGENRRTVAEIHEPYLLRKGLMARTHKGRVATERARRLLSSRKSA
jgi:Holliday junction DNA helicase RuvB